MTTLRFDCAEGKARSGNKSHPGSYPARYSLAALDDFEAKAREDVWRRRLRDVPFNVIAEIGSETVGQASGTAITDDHVELISMCVAPSACRSGAARLLIGAVCGWATGVGAREVRLSVRRDNERAIRSYLSNGFVFTDHPPDEPAELTMVWNMPPN